MLEKRAERFKLGSDCLRSNLQAIKDKQELHAKIREEEAKQARENKEYADKIRKEIEEAEEHNRRVLMQYYAQVREKMESKKMRESRERYEMLEANRSKGRHSNTSPCKHLLIQQNGKEEERRSAKKKSQQR